MDKISDKKLIKQYLVGDEASMEVLVKKYIKPIYSFTYRNVGSAPDAQDITQEVFVKVWKNIRKFDTDKEFKPWLFQIAKNASIDFLRKKKTIPFSRFENERGQNVLLESLAAPSFNIVSVLSDKQTLAMAMQTLSRKEQKIIALRHTYGLSFKEISVAFEESINTVKSRYRRTLQAMKKNISHGSFRNN